MNNDGISIFKKYVNESAKYTNMPSPVLDPPTKPIEKPAPSKPVPSTPPTPRKHPLMPAKRPAIMPRPKAKLSAAAINFFKKRLNRISEKFSFESYFNLLSETVLPSHLEDIINKKYQKEKPELLEIIPYIFEADPTKQKIFCTWILDQAAKRAFILKNGEDVESVRDTLIYFIRFKNSSKFIDFIKKNHPEITQPTNIQLFNYKLLGSVISQFNKIYFKRLESNEKEYIPVLKETAGLHKLGQHGNYVLWKLTRPKTAHEILQQSNFCKGMWCTKKLENWEKYADEFNSIYIVEHNKYLIAMFDTKTKEMKNEHNTTMSVAEATKLFGIFKEELVKDFAARRAAINAAKAAGIEIID